VFERVVRRMRELVRTGRYVMTIHAEEEMTADGLTVFDVEHVILTGYVINRQRDRQTRAWKYVVQGSTLDDEEAVVVAKIGPTGKLVIITVYRL
jgi:hypothetical protein